MNSVTHTVEWAEGVWPYVWADGNSIAEGRCQNTTCKLITDAYINWWGLIVTAGTVLVVRRKYALEDLICFLRLLA
jgi:hypothetical protein